MIRYVGARIRRVEDPPLLQGRGRYVGDLTRSRMLTAAFVRSPHAHARVVTVDARAANAVPGVVAVLTSQDLRPITRPLAPRLEGGGFVPTEWHALTDGVARFCGEAVVAVVGETAYAAADGREAVQVEWEPLPAVVSLNDAPSPETVIFRRDNRRGDVDAAFARAHVVVRECFRHGRLAASSLEGRGLMAEWDDDALTVWASTQVPQILRSALASALSVPESRVRVVVPAVGGGFGMKMQVFPEDVAVAAIARLLRRPVRWVEERREALAAASHAREQQMDVEVAADADGRILGLRARVLSDAGAYHSYPLTQALEPLGSAAILPGPYVTSAYAWEAMAVRTNKPPLGAYRGVGMTMGSFVMERSLDLVAERLGMDPAEVRRRNLVPPDAYPFTSASGLSYDSGDYPRALEQALATADYDQLRRDQKAARDEGRCVGIGLACYTEWTGMGSVVFRGRGMADVPGTEAARLMIDPDGTVRCATSFPSQGQGHATAIAQIVADRLGVPFDRVHVQPADTAASPPGSGTFGSRAAIATAGTVATAAGTLRKKVDAIAAHLLEASAADIVMDAGRASVRGAPDRGITLAEVARIAYAPPAGGLPPGCELGLEATAYFDPPGPVFSGAVHVAVVEVDVDTGQVALVRYVVVEDCGPVVNPMIVEGQIHGAVAQGIGEALMEQVVYDAEGQLLSGTFMEYALPRAIDIPRLDLEHLETPSPRVPGGVKGMGEGGTIGAPAAIANAVADAVSHRGRRVTSLPIRPDLVWTWGAPGAPQAPQPRSVPA